jgi:hypothetical protein
MAELIRPADISVVVRSELHFIDMRRSGFAGGRAGGGLAWTPGGFCKRDGTALRCVQRRCPDRSGAAVANKGADRERARVFSGRAAD